jgi:hypothetical protein
MDNLGSVRVVTKWLYYPKYADNRWHWRKYANIKQRLIIYQTLGPPFLEWKDEGMAFNDDPEVMKFYNKGKIR